LVRVIASPIKVTIENVPLNDNYLIYASFGMGAYFDINEYFGLFFEGRYSGSISASMFKRNNSSVDGPSVAGARYLPTAKILMGGVFRLNL